MLLNNQKKGATQLSICPWEMNIIRFAMVAMQHKRGMILLSAHFNTWMLSSIKYFYK